jgi:hypothetical protein
MIYLLKGPYPDKDGRKFVIVRDGKKRRKINYSKYVLLKEGVEIGPNEEIHHIDGNRFNDSRENLKPLTEHKHKVEDRKIKK